MRLVKEGQLSCTVEMASAKAIDKQGIAVVIRDCIDKGLRDLRQQRGSKLNWEDVAVKLDGSLKAPEYCMHQETIIKGDSKELVIGLASILAKVTRDAYMTKLATKPAFSAYYFNQHKGYGTAAHRGAIARHGLSTEHRASYCRNIEIVV
jgi:ribonuclease HII